MSTDIELIGIGQRELRDGSCIPIISVEVGDLGFSDMRHNLCVFAEVWPHLLIRDKASEKPGWIKFWVREPKAFVEEFSHTYQTQMDRTFGWEKAVQELRSFSPAVTWWIHISF